MFCDLLSQHPHAAGKKNEEIFKKAALGTTFLERCLFGDEPVLKWSSRKKIEKKSEKSEPFAEFLERYLFGDDHRSKKKFIKKFKKDPPPGQFLERYLFGNECDFCRIVKKIEKSSKFFGHFHFFLEDT